jgi:hypothetical protein
MRLLHWQSQLTPGSRVAAKASFGVYLAFMRSFMTMRVVPRFTVKIPSMFCRVFPPRRKPAVVSLAVIVVMINVSVKMFRPMEPGASPDEYAAREPLRSIIAIGRAIIGRNLIVSVRTHGRRTDAD